MAPEKNHLLTHDINTGKLFTLMYLRKKHGHKPFTEAGIYNDIVFKITTILKKRGIITRKWEGLAEKEKQSYAELGEKWDIGTLCYRPYFTEDRKNIIYAFDILQYNTDCIVTYENDNTNYEFRTFFALRIAFTDIEGMYDFLDYQLKENFNNSKKSYAEFLDGTLLSHKHFIEETGKIDKVNRYIQDILIPKHKDVTMEDIPKHATIIPDRLKFETPVKEYTQKELRGLYDMNEKLFRSFMCDNMHEIGKLGKSRRYTAKQVYAVFYLLGDPALKKTT